MKMSEAAAQRILGGIADGSFPIGEELPAEAVLAEECAVSRLTVREAVTSLASRGVIEVRHGRRGRVAPLESWSVLDPDVLALRSRLSPAPEGLVGQLLEARRVLEVSLARLAAERITSSELGSLRDCLAEMKRADADGDSARSAHADLEFHRGVAAAADSAFLAGAFSALDQVLVAARLKTAASSEARAGAIRWHARILEALGAGDAEAAADAMEGHMDQAVRASSGLDLGEDPRAPR
ncbi:FadR/GntR family transcriptional regulator [Arthrobacter sp. UM1]|uniref:FadR/GntR family transcriptional regulator n=1 Tax=Arthrobacter sp. UM1 TaxID=2766776 RepID=UPI001CF62FD3|nr:FCD domain-containing protein [Arthrobacter sp. UM1]MCB4209195.1 FCD domain-containing protein [Arthrobacter sp. UM1]